MTFEEYQYELVKLKQKFEDKKNALMKDYCLANNPYSVGDIITDHIGSIKVEKIGFHFGSYNEEPICVYFGCELKKDLTPTKKGIKRNLYQSNIIK